MATIFSHRFFDSFLYKICDMIRGYHVAEEPLSRTLILESTKKIYKKINFSNMSFKEAVTDVGQISRK